MENNRIADIADEIALLAAMLHEKDEQAFQFVLEEIERLLGEVPEGAQMDRLRKACEYLLEQRNKPDRAALRQELCAFVTALQEFLRDPAAGAFPNESTGGDDSWHADLSPEADTSLIPEFIGQHAGAVEELESDVLNLLNGPGAENPEQTKAFLGQAKAYLHSLKGDAATVGFIGIAEAVHHLEDVLQRATLAVVGEQLLAFREWWAACLQAYTKGDSLKEPAKAFIARLGGAAASAPVETKAEQQPASAGSYKISEEVEVLAEFLAEAEDHLGAVEETLLESKGACQPDHIASFFRAIHSVKGGSSYFELREVTRTSHEVETLLDRARKNEIVFNEELAEVVLEYLDLQKELFARIKSGMEKCRVEECPRVAVFLNRLEAFRGGVGGGPAAGHMAAAAAVSAAPAAVCAADHAPTAPPPREEGEQRASNAAHAAAAAKTFLKVEASRLDQLIDYIGELVISSAMVLRDCRQSLGGNDTAMKNAHRFEQIVRDVQYIAMMMRLVPVKALFQKMSRLVWDLGKRTGKTIRFETEGEDTELDRTVIEQLADPLMHMVRNAADHGVEPSDERLAKGKSAEGTITLRAFHQGGNVYVQIQDDGRGLDPERIFRKAVAQGLVTEDQKLRREEIFQLIFASGFSTAEKVTDISGRGVGMDVVRRNIENLRGRVSITSELGQGTVFTVQLPLTLAIMEGIETVVGNEHFVIPTLSVVEFIKPSSALKTCLQTGEMIEFRGRHLPVFHLSRLYHIPSALESAEDGIVVVVEANGDHAGVAVDAVLGSQASVIKSLGSLFTDARGIAGGAIMPDGHVGLILDVAGLINHARNSGTGSGARESNPVMQ